MISQRSRYALKALLHLARLPSGKVAKARDIAEQENIPEPFLEQIMVDLRRAGFVDSRRGKAGGHLLARPASLVTLAMVLRSIEGPVAPLTCLSRTAYRRCEDCQDEKSCALRRLFKETHDAMLHVLEQRTLADIIENSRGGVEIAPEIFMGAGI
jgi:Rrf2 family protein